MKYAGLIKNDFSAAPGICVSVYLQGCPHKCKNCFNPETWDFKGGKEFTAETIQNIINALKENKVERSLCILGGEPLCPENEFLTQLIITEVKKQLPNTKIYIWTGYIIEELVKNKTINSRIIQILYEVDYLIDGPYIDELRDITLPMRGSSNQRIINLKEYFKGENDYGIKNNKL